MENVLCLYMSCSWNLSILDIYLHRAMDCDLSTNSILIPIYPANAGFAIKLISLLWEFECISAVRKPVYGGSNER